MANAVLTEKSATSGRDRSPKKNAQRRSRESNRTTLLVRLAQVGIVAALLIGWQLVATGGVLEPVLAKTPGQSWAYFTSAWASGELWTHLVSTMSAVIIAWVLASVAGVLVGLTLGLLPTLERIVAPFFDTANAMPRLALAPLFIVIFGISQTAKVVLAFTLVFFIVASGARAGVRSTDFEWLRLSTVMDASKFQVFTNILLPVATPAIFAALRLALIYSLLAVVSSELISAREGLGQQIALYSSQFRMEAVYAIVIFLALLASALNQIMSLIERYILRWQAPADR